MNHPNENPPRDDRQPQEILETGSVLRTRGRYPIHVLTVIGQIEGHSLAPTSQKTTKYEHVIPQLATVEEDPDTRGLLVILNTVGGDVEAGLALAELIAGLSKPTATLVLGGGHSIGIPLAVSADRSFIVPTATMTIHPVRHSGLMLGVPETMTYFEEMQNRITGFVSGHSRIPAERFTLFQGKGNVIDCTQILCGSSKEIRADDKIFFEVVYFEQNVVVLFFRLFLARRDQPHFPCACIFTFPFELLTEFLLSHRNENIYRIAFCELKILF